MTTTYFKRPFFIAVFVSLALGFTACNDDEEDNTPLDTRDPNAGLKTEIKANYAAIVYASYEDSYNEAKELQTAVNSFTANPSEAGFDDCKQKWLDSREPYGQTEAYRFANGPIDDANGPEGALNAWPLDEGYVDYIRGGVDSSIISNTSAFPNLTATILAAANEAKSEKNISIGYHAIEFLLWGQDDADASLLTKGNRSFTDYEDGGTNGNQARRREYLRVATDILIADLKTMVDHWDPSKSNNYSASFLATDNNTVLKNILTALGTLSKSELGGERMFVALNNQDQEDEHSCFSDNTHRDMILNAQGIRNVYIGSYVRVNGAVVSGSSIQHLIQLLNANMASEMNVLSAKTISNAEAIPIPFDNALTQEVIGGNGPIMSSVRTLQDQGDKIAEIATAFGLTISTELPE